MFGPLAALASSVTWAYSSTRYAQASRAAGSVRVNLARAAVVVPIYLALVFTLGASRALAAVDGRLAAWLLVSVLCSYALADALFFAAARRLGISTALSIASSYPLWAALLGALVRHEPFGPARAAGTLLCTGGVMGLVRLHISASGAPEDTNKAHAVGGFVLAAITSVLWAGNSFAIKEASVGLSPLPLNAVRYAMALVLLAAQAPFSRGTRPGGGWLRLVPAILCDALLGSLLYVYGLAHTDLAVGATLSSLAPLVSVPFAIALGEERWSTPRFIAIAATVSGIVILVAS